MKKEELKKKVRAFLNNYGLLSPEEYKVRENYKIAEKDYLRARDSFWRARDAYQAFLKNKDEQNGQK